LLGFQYKVGNPFGLLTGERLDFQYVNPRLNAVNDFVDVRAHRYEVDIILVFIDIIAEYLLTRLVYGVHIVNHDQLLLTINRTMRPTERLHLVSIVIDAALFQIIDEHDVRVGKRVRFFQIIILPDDCI
jgi:hypothetical protein